MKKIIKIMIIFAFISLSSQSLATYLSQINKNSSSENIQKLQNIFKELWLYSWNVDGKFDSIKDNLIQYQVKNNIITSENAQDAWYFGNKTIKNLEKQYWENFLKLKEKYLKLKEVEIWEKATFVATAYYSPVRWQKKYYRWTYEAEIALQWNWRTAMWKIANIWSLSAPKNYKFWTKIYLEGIWIWEVQDRGWSIQGNRIDIWMWVGDEWRERALKRWKRTIQWEIVDKNQQINMEFEKWWFFVKKDLTEWAKTSQISEETQNVEIENFAKNKYQISEKKKLAIKLAGDAIRKILQKRTKSQTELELEIMGLKTELRSKLPKLSEKKQIILEYLIEVL